MRISQPLAPLDLNDNRAVLLLLSDTINRVRAGSMDVRIANCLGFLSSKILEAREKISLEERLDELEDALPEQRFIEMVHELDLENFVRILSNQW